VIVLDDVPAGPREIPLFSGDRRIGRLELVEPPAILDANTAARVGAMLGGLIAIAQERDRLTAAR
jgi:hypothetical protein